MESILLPPIDDFASQSKSEKVPIVEAKCSSKLTKSERRIMKKKIKSQQTLLRHENVIASEQPTNHLLVANGGLANDVEREELFGIFKPYGNIADIVMKPMKPFAFVSFTTKDEAARAIDGVNGRELSCPEEMSRPNVKFYLSYIDKIPCFEKIIIDEKPNGLLILENVISSEYEQQMLNCVDWSSSDNDGSQVLKHRRVKHYGYKFDYSVNTVDRDHPLEEKIPDVCNTVLNRLLDQRLISCMPDQLTVNQYLPGQGIPPHVDTHSAFEDYIAVVSLQSQVVMDFRRPDGRHVPMLLPGRSVAIMGGESRYLWTHGITPRHSDIVHAVNELDPHDSDATSSRQRLTLVKRGTRTSFTFRKVRTTPCNCCYAEQCDSALKDGARTKKDTNEKLDGLAASTDKEAAILESNHVHQVYEEIAQHFSSTRHTPWPMVTSFLNELEQGSIVLDVGCGNGKYLGIRKQEIFMVGCDRSSSLCDICHSKQHESFMSDSLSLPFRNASCDAVICIAVIHHLATEPRRLAALKEIARVLIDGGLALVYVWAMEQEKDQVKSKYLKQTPGSNHERPPVDGEQENGSMPVHVNRTQFQSQDVLVPWHLKEKTKPTDRSKKEKKSRTDSHTEKPLSNLQPSSESDVKCPIPPSSECEPNQGAVEGNVYHRYYHVFRSGELETLCASVGSVDLVKSYYDQGNWCVVVKKTARVQ